MDEALDPCRFISAGSYRLGLVCPAVVMGLAPAAIGIVTAIGLVTLWALFFLFECFTDIALLIAIRNVPRHLMVLALPDQLGCQVMMNTDSAMRR